MSHAIIGLCTLDLHIPGVASLKEKRGYLKSILNRLHNKFNVSAAEVGNHDKWQLATIAFAVVSGSGAHADQVLAKAINFIEASYPDVIITGQDIEII
jgi:hypothetical protein